MKNILAILIFVLTFSPVAFGQWRMPSPLPMEIEEPSEDTLKLLLDFYTPPEDADAETLMKFIQSEGLKATPEVRQARMTVPFETFAKIQSEAQQTAMIRFLQLPNVPEIQRDPILQILAARTRGATPEEMERLLKSVPESDWPRFRGIRKFYALYAKAYAPKTQTPDNLLEAVKYGMEQDLLTPEMLDALVHMHLGPVMLDPSTFDVPTPEAMRALNRRLAEIQPGARFSEKEWQTFLANLELYPVVCEWFALFREMNAVPEEERDSDLARWREPVARCVAHSIPLFERFAREKNLAYNGNLERFLFTGRLVSQVLPERYVEYRAAFLRMVSESEFIPKEGLSLDDWFPASVAH